MQLVMDRVLKRRLLSPEKASKKIGISQDNILKLFTEGEIKNILTGVELDSQGHKIEYRHTTERWLKEWTEKTRKN